MANIIPAAEYYRMSTDDQETSIPSQQAAVRPYAKANSYRIVATYADEGISGDETAKRKAFQRMIADATAGKFKAIVCWDQDRFGRFDSLEAGYWIHPLRQAGVVLVTVTDGLVNWDDFTGRVMYSLKQETKHQYLRDLSRNVLRGMHDLARLGQWVSGRPPLGYVLGDDRKLKLGSPDAIAAVRFLFDGYLAGHSLRSLTEAANAKGYRTLAGKEFGYVGVRFILRNANYTGDFHWNLRSDSKYNSLRRGEVKAGATASRFTDEADWIRVPDNHPPIVTKAEYAAVQAKLDERQHATTPYRAGGRFVLSGLLRCLACGGPMTGATYGGLLYYVCCNYYHRGSSFCNRNAVRQEQLVGTVVERIEDEFLEPSAVKRLREAVRRKAATARPRAGDASQLDGQLAKVRRELATAERNMALAGSDALRTRYEAVVTDLAGREQRIIAAAEAARQPRCVLVATADARVDAALAEFKRLRPAMLSSDTMRLREAMHQAVQKIEVRVRREERTKRARYYLDGGKIHMKPLSLLSEDQCSKQVLRFGSAG